MHELSRLRFLRRNTAARPEQREWPRVMSINMPSEVFPPEIEKRDNHAPRQDPAKRKNRPLVSLTFFKECRQNNVFEDPELGHVKYLGHFEKLFVLFCHLFLLCLEASYVSIAADTAAFKLSVLPDMGI